jgi:hypothetical protein
MKRCRLTLVHGRGQDICTAIHAPEGGQPHRAPGSGAFAAELCDVGLRRVVVVPPEATPRQGWNAQST